MLIDLHVPKDRKISCNTILVKALQLLGVEFVFGIPGGYLEPLLNAIAQSSIKFILSRHESGAAFMAEGYARKSGKLGVCCATAGPGSTNSITGIASAFSSNTPLLIITAQTAINRFGYFGLQESTPETVDTVKMLSACTRYSSLVSHPDQLFNKLSIALGIAFGSNPGPVHLSFPSDILQAQPDLEINSTCRLPKRQQIGDLNAENFAMLVDAIETARSGVFVLGPQAQGAIVDILMVAKLLNWAVVSTPMTKGLIACDHPLNAGVYGMAGHTSAEEQLTASNTDIIFAIGFTADEVSTKGWQKKGVYSEKTVVLSTCESSIISFPYPRMKFLCNLSNVFSRLKNALNLSREEKSGLRQFGIKYSDIKRTTPGHNDQICPVDLLKKLNSNLPADTTAVFDAGNAFLWGIHYWQIKRGLSSNNLMYIETGFAAMGWAISAAVGLSFANKGHRTIVCFTGDGSMLMNGNEITVAAENKLNIIFVVLNDAELGTVKHGQILNRSARIATSLPQMNFADLAKTCGLYSVRLNNRADLHSLDISQVASRTPALIDACIDENITPPLGDRLNNLNIKNDN